jgi:hypothetical protein
VDTILNNRRRTIMTKPEIKEGEQKPMLTPTMGTNDIMQLNSLMSLEQANEIQYLTKEQIEFICEAKSLTSINLRIKTSIQIKTERERKPQDMIYNGLGKLMPIKSDKKKEEDVILKTKYGGIKIVGEPEQGTKSINAERIKHSLSESEFAQLKRLPDETQERIKNYPNVGLQRIQIEREIAKVEGRIIERPRKQHQTNSNTDILWQSEVLSILKHINNNLIELKELINK